MAQEMQSWTPATVLSLEQEAKKSTLALQWLTSPQEASKAAKRLIGSWPHANPPDADGWVASLAAVLAGYPLGVVQECADPRVGLARGREFPPTVAAIVEWCDRRTKYHRGMIRWAGLPPDVELQYSSEHRQSMLQRLSALMHGLLRA